MNKEFYSSSIIWCAVFSTTLILQLIFSQGSVFLGGPGELMTVNFSTVCRYNLRLEALIMTKEHSTNRFPRLAIKHYCYKLILLTIKLLVLSALLITLCSVSQAVLLVVKIIIWDVVLSNHTVYKVWLT